MVRAHERFSAVRSLVVAATMLGCSSPPVAADLAPPKNIPSASAIVVAPTIIPTVEPAVSIAKPEVSPDKPVGSAISKSVAETILLANELPAGVCPDNDDNSTIRCWLEKRYENETSAKSLALSLFDGSEIIAGVEGEHMMDGGFRGMIHIVPEWPVRQYRKHLEWVVATADDMNVFFDKLKTKSQKRIDYRHRGIAFKFMRSVNRRTPSAYASEWAIGYNVSGSLHVSVDAVRETLFHEIFHLNDSDHAIGRMNWSEKALRTIHDAILAQCSTRISCLTPYAPMPTMVRGGTYYAFQPNNGDAVHEYGAELATRYYREQRAILRGEKLPGRPFKCGPKENADAWKLLIDEFFAGIDLVPAC